MLNNHTGAAVQQECDRLLQYGKLTQRGFRRYVPTVIGEDNVLTIVFDLQAGESPKKSIFEHMFRYADERMKLALEDAEHFKLVEVKRSPKFGKVTYQLAATFDPKATLANLRNVLMELRRLAVTCGCVDIHGAKMFQ